MKQDSLNLKHILFVINRFHVVHMMLQTGAAIHLSGSYPMIILIFCDLVCLVCLQSWCLQCFDTVGWTAGRASGL